MRDISKSKTDHESSDGQLVVTRSNVPVGLPYPDYRRYLRWDFFYSCAYCTITESEATAIRFCIDHYEPKSARPDLENDYSNLMYACDHCNTLKGSRYPSRTQVDADLRFFRPDADAYYDHFNESGIRLEPKSNVGYYSIEALDLNRHSLRKLRELRSRLKYCDRFAMEGVHALKQFSIDQLPSAVKGAAAKAIREMDSLGEQIVDEIDTLLRNYAKSELIDPDPDAKARARARSVKLRQMQGLAPGEWSDRDRHKTSIR